MTPAEAGAATVIAICAGVAALYRYLCWLIDRKARRLRTRRNQLQLDLARFRAGRLAPPAVEQQPGDPYSDDRIAAELIFIPQQRTEDHR